MNTTRLFFLLFGLTLSVSAQNITWLDISSLQNLPEGVKLFQGTRVSPPLKIWYMDVNMNKNYIVKAYTTPLQREGIVAFAARYGALGAINGGYFDPASGAMLSTVVQPDNVLAKNVTSVQRAGKTYFLTRSFWGLKDDRTSSIDWIYHYGNRPIDIYRFAQPTQNTNGTPAPSPNQAAGTPYYELLTGAGGGPTLINNGAIQITYDQEVFFDSGVALSSVQPRTAIGITASGRLLLLVADGRQTASDGLTLTELASIMLGLGCTEAMNLDGGGSTQMVVKNTVINLPEGVGAQRLLPCILAVVPADSLPVLPPVFYNKKIDTGDPGCTLAGNWTVSNVGGFWGSTPSYIAKGGTGSATATFKLELPKSGNYTIDAWWTAAINRSIVTPFIVQSNGRTDTVRHNQTTNAAKWNRLGTFAFSGNDNDKVVVNNRVDTNTYVCVDAIRITSADAALSASEGELSGPALFSIAQNYPNPFNASTNISFTLRESGEVRLSVFDMLGREVEAPVNGYLASGDHSISFSGNTLPSGVYVYRFAAGGGVASRKMVLLK